MLASTQTRINTPLLSALSAHTRRLGIKRIFQSMSYERCAELPRITEQLQARFDQPLRYLDIGTGNSVFPTFLLANSRWDITCIDKFSWVNEQHVYAQRLGNGIAAEDRLHVIEKDLLEADLPEASFDVITNISVIEHFEGHLDSAAMQQSARLLKPGGQYIVTTLMNDGYPQEFYVNHDVYGEQYSGDNGKGGVFFQRHYDVASYERRVLKASGLQEISRIYFGDYGFQFCEKFMVMPWPWKPIKLFYQWATPFFASRFLTYSDQPVSRADMHMYTSAGVISVLTRSEDDAPCA